MLATLIVLATSIFLSGAIVWFGARKPGYSHFRHTISELGEVGAERARAVSLGVFLPVGLALLLVAALVRAVDATAALLAVCIAVGYLVAVLFPCDPGSPLAGSARQAVHNLGGGVEYVGGALTLWRLAEDHGSLVGLAGLLVGVTVVALSVPTFSGARGLVQRVGELALFSGLLRVTWLVDGVVQR